MTSKTDLKVWAKTLDIDGVTGLPQKLVVGDDLWEYGWLRNVPVTYHHLNQLLYLITDALKNETLTPSDNLDDLTDKTAARTNLGTLTLASNLSDVPDKATARANLGITTDTELFNTFFDTFYPVGTIYENKTNAANPATYLGRGTWVADGEGRVVIGAGTGTDVNGVARNFTAGTTGGEYEHTLTVAEIPSHSHTFSVDAADNSGGFVADSDGSGANSTVTTSSTGGDQAHENTQPYIVYYRWVRTA